MPIQVPEFDNPSVSVDGNKGGYNDNNFVFTPESKAELIRPYFGMNENDVMPTIIRCVPKVVKTEDNKLKFSMTRVDHGRDGLTPFMFFIPIAENVGSNPDFRFTFIPQHPVMGEDQYRRPYKDHMYARSRIFKDDSRPSFKVGAGSVTKEQLLEFVNGYKFNGLSKNGKPYQLRMRPLPNCMPKCLVQCLPYTMKIDKVNKPCLDELMLPPGARDDGKSYYMYLPFTAEKAFLKALDEPTTDPANAQSLADEYRLGHLASLTDKGFFMAIHDVTKPFPLAYIPDVGPDARSPLARRHVFSIGQESATSSYAVSFFKRLQLPIERDGVPHITQITMDPVKSHIQNVVKNYQYQSSKLQVMTTEEEADKLADAFADERGRVFLRLFMEDTPYWTGRIRAVGAAQVSAQVPGNIQDDNVLEPVASPAPSSLNQQTHTVGNNFNSPYAAQATTKPAVEDDEIPTLNVDPTEYGDDIEIEIEADGDMSQHGGVGHELSPDDLARYADEMYRDLNK